MTIELETVTLKTGDEVRAIRVIAALDYLRGMLNGLPNGEDVLTDLHHICRGERGLARPESVALLIQRRDVFPQADGHLEPDADLKKVLLAAFHLSPEGVVLVNPVQPTTQNQETLDRARHEDRRKMDDFFRGGGQDSDGPSSGGRY